MLFYYFQETFGRAKTWVKELQRQASPNIVIALAGNKADLAAKRSVELDEAQAYAHENGLLFMETSAKTAMNVNDIFLAIGELPDTNPVLCYFLGFSTIWRIGQIGSKTRQIKAGKSKKNSTWTVENGETQ